VGTCALASPLPSLAVINVTSQSALGFALLSLSCYFTTYREKLQISDTSFVLHLLISKKKLGNLHATVRLKMQFREEA